MTLTSTEEVIIVVVVVELEFEGELMIIIFMQQTTLFSKAVINKFNETSQMKCQLILLNSK